MALTVRVEIDQETKEKISGVQCYINELVDRLSQTGVASEDMPSALIVIAAACVGEATRIQAFNESGEANR